VILESLLLQKPGPPISPFTTPMLFAPGLEGLCRMASPREAEVWDSLERPISREVAMDQGYRDELISMLQVGAVEMVRRTAAAA
jgi:hypothetical protein